MAVNDLFKKVPVEIPNRSGFDESHEHNFSASVGTLVPAMVDMLLPNDTISLSVGSEIQLPPMATDFYGRIKAHYEAFFVPFRTLYAGWQTLITQPVNGQRYPDGTSVGNKMKYLPRFNAPANMLLSGSLADYLGYGFNGPFATGSKMPIANPLRFLAYHKIYDDFYRDSRIQAPAFAPSVVNSERPGNSVAWTGATVGQLPYVNPWSNWSIDAPAVITDDALKFNDGVHVCSLRQRNWGRDYFTNATPLPQAGEGASVAFGVDNSQGAFSIASLRAANSLQTWLERNNVAGFRYGDQIRAHFGIYPSDAALDRPLYLGRQVVDVYNKSVYQTDSSSTEGATNNPFNSVGSKYGSPLGVGSGQLVDKFTASEHGYIFVMFSLVPEAVYGDTINREFFYNSSADFPFPLLQGVGDQPISYAELVGYLAGDASTLASLQSGTFAYTQRYANHKFMLDRVSGLLKDNQSLASFALQRSFEPDSGGAMHVDLSSAFLQIPTNYLDQVAAVSGDVSRYGCWTENYFTYHKVSTLAAYSVPTLGEPKNTHTEVIPNGGTRL